MIIKIYAEGHIPPDYDPHIGFAVLDDSAALKLAAGLEESDGYGVLKDGDGHLDLAAAIRDAHGKLYGSP